jgi:hypothetical protein
MIKGLNLSYTNLRGCKDLFQIPARPAKPVVSARKQGIFRNDKKQGQVATCLYSILGKTLIECKVQ